MQRWTRPLHGRGAGVFDTFSPAQLTLPRQEFALDAAAYLEAAESAARSIEGSDEACPTTRADGPSRDRETLERPNRVL